MAAFFLQMSMCECESMRFNLLSFPGYHQASNVFDKTYVCPDWCVIL